MKDKISFDGQNAKDDEEELSQEQMEDDILAGEDLLSMTADTHKNGLKNGTN
jgi:hypothetical protein